MSNDKEAHIGLHKLSKEDLGTQNHPYAVNDITIWRKQHFTKHYVKYFKQGSDFSSWVDFAQEFKDRREIALKVEVTYHIIHLMQAIDPTKFESNASNYDRGVEHWNAVIANNDNP